MQARAHRTLSNSEESSQYPPPPTTVPPHHYPTPPNASSSSPPQQQQQQQSSPPSPSSSSSSYYNTTTGSKPIHYNSPKTSPYPTPTTNYSTPYSHSSPPFQYQYSFLPTPLPPQYHQPPPPPPSLYTHSRHATHYTRNLPQSVPHSLYNNHYSPSSAQEQIEQQHQQEAAHQNINFNISSANKSSPKLRQDKKRSKKSNQSKSKIHTSKFNSKHKNKRSSSRGSLEPHSTVSSLDAMVTSLPDNLQPLVLKLTDFLVTLIRHYSWSVSSGTNNSNDPKTASEPFIKLLFRTLSYIEEQENESSSSDEYDDNFSNSNNKTISDNNNNNNNNYHDTTQQDIIGNYYNNRSDYSNSPSIDNSNSESPSSSPSHSSTKSSTTLVKDFVPPSPQSNHTYSPPPSQFHQKQQQQQQQQQQQFSPSNSSPHPHSSSSPSPPLTDNDSQNNPPMKLKSEQSRYFDYSIPCPMHVTQFPIFSQTMGKLAPLEVQVDHKPLNSFLQWCYQNSSQFHKKDFPLPPFFSFTQRMRPNHARSLFSQFTIPTSVSAMLRKTTVSVALMQRDQLFPVRDPVFIVDADNVSIFRFMLELKTRIMYPQESVCFKIFFSVLDFGEFSVDTPPMYFSMEVINRLDPENQDESDQIEPRQYSHSQIQSQHINDLMNFSNHYSNKNIENSHENEEDEDRGDETDETDEEDSENDEAIQELNQQNDDENYFNHSTKLNHSAMGIFNFQEEPKMNETNRSLGNVNVVINTKVITELIDWCQKNNIKNDTLLDFPSHFLQFFDPKDYRSQGGFKAPANVDRLLSNCQPRLTFIQESPLAKRQRRTNNSSTTTVSTHEIPKGVIYERQYFENKNENVDTSLLKFEQVQLSKSAKRSVFNSCGFLRVILTVPRFGELYGDSDFVSLDSGIDTTEKTFEETIFPSSGTLTGGTIHSISRPNIPSDTLVKNIIVTIGDTKQDVIQQTHDSIKFRLTSFDEEGEYTLRIKSNDGKEFLKTSFIINNEDDENDDDDDQGPREIDDSDSDKNDDNDNNENDENDNNSIDNNSNNDDQIESNDERKNEINSSSLAEHI